MGMLVAREITSRGTPVVTSASISLFFSTLIVGLRLFTRLNILRYFGREDWCILLAWVFSIGNSAGMIFQAERALGRHITDLSLDQIIAFGKGGFFTIIFYNLSLTLAKLSTLFLYIRVFQTSKMQKICRVLFGIITLYGIWCFFSSIFGCYPVDFFWDKSKKGKCLPMGPLWFLNAGMNIATDFMILLSPIPVIGRLALPRKQKIGLYFVFALGFFVCIVSILRLYSLHIAMISSDPTWDNIGISVWSSIELNVAIICPCLTTLKPLISRFFPRLLASTKDGTYYIRYSHGVDVENGKSRKLKVERATQGTTQGTVVGSDVEALNTDEGITMSDMQSERAASKISCEGKEDDLGMRVVPL